MFEIWKDIMGYEGLYQVSNKGRIKGLDRMGGHNLGGLRKFKGGIKKSVIRSTGYPMIMLYKNNKCKNYYIHRLVAQHFILNPENKPLVNHKNGVKTDCYVENLEYSTYSENLLHAYKTGAHKPRKRNKENLIIKSEVA